MAKKTILTSMVPLFLFVVVLTLVPSAPVIHAKVTHYQHHELFPNKRQAHYVNSLSSYDVITPIKVTHDGDFLSHNLNHARDVVPGEWAEAKRRRRRKRDIGSERSGELRENLVHYSLNLNGEDHIVQLEPNHIFLAPGAVVERRGGSTDHKIGNMTSHLSVIGSSPRCHYVGHVFNHTSSKVALSACNGLFGFVKTDFDEFLIEPILDNGRGPDDPHPHLVYRKSSLPEASNHGDMDLKEDGDNHEGTCSSENYEKAIRERMEWEDRGREGSLSPGRPSDEGDSLLKRRKRSVSVERNVEVLVVADKKMIDYYANEDLNTYILTVMNMVSSIFHDASIGNAVNIIIVRIMLLETPQYEEELYISHDADETLSSFCKWQQMVNPSSENHPYHHDVAVLLTRYNICSRSNDHCSTLGLAEIAGMCQTHRSCNVNEDTGLPIAYTIAHEIGHNFGMNHDGTVNGCGSHFGINQHVMSPHLASDSIPITWSNCSRHEITKFLDRDWGICLEDEPLEVEYNFPELPPGAMYDASHQCRLIYGPSAEHCDGMEVECETLWCKVNDRCITRLESAAEGTQCGKHKWCSQGNCVTMGDRPAAIHGSWGQWSTWSSCSRSCGAGVEIATRHCDNPAPSNGGRYCTGDRRRYRICNTQECPVESVSLRALQCSDFDNVSYKGKNYTWHPVTIERSPCQLHCKPDNEFYSVELKDTVLDGTPCRPGTRDMCIHGVCKRVTCDWTIEGVAQEDRCGLCHGDGTQCVTTKGVFNVTEGISYISIVTIPVGARNIKVEEMGDAANYLAVRDQETGKYHLNGNWIIQWSGEYSADGVMIYYRRDNETEAMFMPGPIKRPLTLMLLFQTRNPGVRWEYTLPHENATYTPEFHWEYSDWSVCTHTCGGGNQVSKGLCMEKEAGLVEDRYCKETRPQEMHRECNNHPCPAWWWSGPWQPCSVTCGSSGTKKRTVICVRSYGPTEQMALMDSDCILEDKPHEEEWCQDLLQCPTDTSWTVRPWIESCRGDPCEFERREVKCSVGSGKCDPLTRPADRRQCGNISCGHWETRAWAECSTTCGEGVQIRDVHCVGGSACIRVDEPGSVKECKIVDCPVYPHPSATTKTEETLHEWHNEIDPEKSGYENDKKDFDTQEKETKPAAKSVESVSRNETGSNGPSSSGDAAMNINGTANGTDLIKPNNSLSEERNNPDDQRAIDGKDQEAIHEVSEGINQLENATYPTSHDNITNESEREKAFDSQPEIVRNSVISATEGTKTDSPKELTDANSSNETKHSEKSNTMVETSLEKPEENEPNATLNEGFPKGESPTEKRDWNETSKEKETEKNAKDKKEKTKKIKKVDDSSALDYAEVPDDYYDPVDATEEPKRKKPDNETGTEGNKQTPRELIDSKLKEDADVKKELLETKNVTYEKEEEKQIEDKERRKLDDTKDDVTNSLGGEKKNTQNEDINDNTLNIAHEESHADSRDDALDNSQLNKIHSSTHDDILADSKDIAQVNSHDDTLGNSLDVPQSDSHNGTQVNPHDVTQSDFHGDTHVDTNAASNDDNIEDDVDDYVSDDYEYDEDEAYSNDTSAEVDGNSTEVERPQGFVDDKIDVAGVQVIEIINKRKKHKSIKKVKIHTGEEAIKVLNRFSKKAIGGKASETSLHQSPSSEEDSEMKPNFKWTIGPWSKCSEPCGGGSEHRAVECHNTSTDSIVPPWKCHTLPPPDMQHCNLFQCMNWTVSEFGPCSAVCGEGIRIRNATCPKEGRCHQKDVPSLQTTCVEDPCVKWVEGPWSMCTKSCGGGYQIRFVKCVDVRTQEASQHCTNERPPHKKMCNVSKCQKDRQSQQNHCKDHMDTKLCSRLVHMCTTKFIKTKCCRTCHRSKGS